MENMSSFFDLLSHTDRTLREHLNSCNEISQKLLESKYISNSFYPKEQIHKWLKLLAFYHDMGKASDFFQNKIIQATLERGKQDFINQHQAYIDFFIKNKQHDAEKIIHSEPGLDSHARIGSYYLLENLHVEDKIIPNILINVANAHHGNLPDWEETASNPFFLSPERKERLELQIENINFQAFNNIINENDLKSTPEFWNEIIKIYGKNRKINAFQREIRKADTYHYFFLQHLLYSLLLSADKGDVMLSKERKLIHDQKLFPGTIIQQYKQHQFPSNNKNPIDQERESAFQKIDNNISRHANESFFSITLPTGLGKTLSAYNAAIKLQNIIAKNKSYTPRIIYCLPFTSIIDQNSAVLNDIFTYAQIPDWHIAKHHYLTDFNEQYAGENLSGQEAEYLTEGWEQDFIITTFNQLLESLFSNKNKALRKFHNMANSIIILDEVQNIPPKYYEVIEDIFFKMAEFFNTKFLFVTATQPFILSKKHIIELTDSKETQTKEFFTSKNRIILDQHLLKSNDYHKTEIEGLTEQFINDIEKHKDKSFLFILNTVASSQYVFNILKEAFPDIHITYLSSSVLPYRRKQLIKLIQRRINRNIRQIIVSTQVVEAGVDIDLDIVYRDFAPMDSINQSAGRCNRNGIKGKGIVKLFNSGKSKIYDPILMKITQNILAELPEEIAESSFFNINQNYFSQVQESISEVSDEADTLKKAIKQLQIETVKKNFILIKELPYYYNVFIPYHRKAEKIWEDYKKCLKIEDFFERKEKLRKIKPLLLQFVTRFPEKYYEPTSQPVGNIFKEDDWSIYYNLISGFQLDKDNQTVLV